MDGFRRFIIVIAEFFQIIFIFASTAFGGYAAYLYARYLETMPTTDRPEMYIGDMPARVVFITIFGGLSGFVVAATVSATFFIFCQIEKNTRTPIANRVMPRF
jgi:hypothetical protein